MLFKFRIKHQFKASSLLKCHWLKAIDNKIILYKHWRQSQQSIPIIYIKPIINWVPQLKKNYFKKYKFS